MKDFTTRKIVSYLRARSVGKYRESTPVGNMGVAMMSFAADRLAELDAKCDALNDELFNIKLTLVAVDGDAADAEAKLAAVDALRPPCPTCGDSTDPAINILTCPDCVDGKVSIERLAVVFNAVVEGLQGDSRFCDTSEYYLSLKP